MAAAIHDVDATGYVQEYFPWHQQATTGPPALATRPDLWRAALDHWLRHQPAYRPTFIHRDFHPGNILWRRGAPTAVVDWVEACRGPWGCDIAHCRSELLRLAGPEAADRFLAAYQSLTGRTMDPYWEIASVLEHGPSGYDAATVARSERRLARALR